MYDLFIIVFMLIFIWLLWMVVKASVKMFKGLISIFDKTRYSNMREEFLLNNDAEHTYNVTSIDGTAYFLKVGESQTTLGAVSIVLRREGITIYDETGNGRKPILIAPYHTIRGVFHSSTNNKPLYFAMHFHNDDRWQVLLMPANTLKHKSLTPLLDILGEILGSARYAVFRDRLYVHSEVIKVYETGQSVTGKWELIRPIMLYVMPLYTILTNQSGEILNIIASDNIETVSKQFDLMQTQHQIIQITTYAGQQHKFATQEYNLSEIIAEAAAQNQGLKKSDILLPAEARKSYDDWQVIQEKSKKMKQ